MCMVIIGEFYLFSSKNFGLYAGKRYGLVGMLPPRSKIRIHRFKQFLKAIRLRDFFIELFEVYLQKTLCRGSLNPQD